MSDDQLPPIGRPYQRGDFVQLTCAGRTVQAMITMASPNGRSLVAMFEALVDGHAGVMPLSQLDDGSFVALITGTPVTLVRLP